MARVLEEPEPRAALAEMPLHGDPAPSLRARGVHVHELERGAGLGAGRGRGQAGRVDRGAEAEVHRADGGEALELAESWRMYCVTRALLAGFGT